jgi:TorA maturation chaperone TorD
MTATTAARADLIRSLAVCAEPPTAALEPVAALLGLPRMPTAAEHTDTFTFQLHPYASVHLGPEGQLGGVARDRVAGFFRALEVVPPTEPDHLVVLLGAYAQLVDLDVAGEGTRARHARIALLHEHLWPWLPRLSWRITELGAAPYRSWARLLGDLMGDEVAALRPPATLSAHLREAPGLGDPREGDVGEFLAGLLAPVRSGLILARSDLARAARELDLGLRIGERAYMLRALLGQDPSPTLRFLASEAERQRDHVPGDDATARFWTGRLESTARLLESLADVAISGIDS